VYDIHNGGFMERKNFYLSEMQIEKLNIASSGTGLSSSEILRRIIDNYFDSKDFQIQAHYPAFSGN
jgi:predicted DNA-binding protein